MKRFKDPRIRTFTGAFRRENKLSEDLLSPKRSMRDSPYYPWSPKPPGKGH
jgi:hypothetical protein